MNVMQPDPRALRLDEEDASPGGTDPVSADRSVKICPITGFEVQQRPEWIRVAFEDDFRLSAEIIGGCILLTHNYGRATMEGVRKAFAFTEALIAEHMGGRPYVHILDYTHLDGTSLEGRRYFIRCMLQRRQLAGVIFYGLSPLLRMSTQLGKRLHIIPFDVHIANDYPTAAPLACKLLDKAQGSPPADLRPAGFSTQDYRDRDGFLHTILRCEDWAFERDGYGVRFEVIDGHILHSVSKGAMGINHLPDLLALRDRVYTSLHEVHGPLCMVVGMRELQRVERRVRRFYIQAISAWHRKVSFQAYIIYGLNPFMAAVANFSKFTLPFKLGVGTDLDDALHILKQPKPTAHEKEQGGLGGVAPTARNEREGKTAVGQLLEYIGSIDWAQDGLATTQLSQGDPSLAPIYDAISVIKSEVDDLLQEKNEAEKALLQARDELDGRVRERTAELIETNKRLQNEIAERREIEVAQRASEKNYRDLVDSVNSIILRWDAEGRIVFMNSYGLSFFGYDADELIGKNVVGTIVPESESISKRDLARLMEKIRKDPDLFRNNENENVTRDGRLVWIYWTNRAITDREGRIVEILSVGNDITGRRHMEAELRRLATTDPLTGAINRRRFFQKARQEFLRHQRYGHPLSVLLMDMDHFKKINDTYGHPVGDSVLKMFVQTCQDVFRVTDVFGRTGGEEFSAILPETRATDALGVAERLRQRVASCPIVGEDEYDPIRFTVSVGLTDLHEDDLTLESMIRRADQALYTAKRTGRNRVVEG